MVGSPKVRVACDPGTFGLLILGIGAAGREMLSPGFPVPVLHEGVVAGRAAAQHTVVRIVLNKLQYQMRNMRSHLLHKNKNKKPTWVDSMRMSPDDKSRGVMLLRCRFGELFGGNF